MGRRTGGENLAEQPPAALGQLLATGR